MYIEKLQIENKYLRFSFSKTECVDYQKRWKRSKNEGFQSIAHWLLNRNKETQNSNRKEWKYNDFGWAAQRGKGGSEWLMRKYENEARVSNGKV